MKAGLRLRQGGYLCLLALVLATTFSSVTTAPRTEERIAEAAQPTGDPQEDHCV